MGVHVVNEKDVELAKTGQGYTKFLYQSADGSGPSIMIRCWGPETDLDVHSHPYNELFYVLEGEVEMGGNVYTEGACIFISKDTPYGPTRSPKGARLLRYAEAGRSG
jgi:quercetin dioxygenase-like cupin family protein